MHHKWGSAEMDSQNVDTRIIKKAIYKTPVFKV